MDFVAIQKATDKDLEVLGLTKKGDLFALRSFVDCNTASQQVCEERVQKKKKLLRQLRLQGRKIDMEIRSPIWH